MPENIAFIPARGGSKRLPRKNILPFMGKPMLAHTVEAALKSEVFKEVVFSSDDQKMLDTAQSYGAIPIKRPAELATDNAVFFTAIEHAQKQRSWSKNQNICLLMPNCPLRNTNDIKKSAEEFGKNSNKFMISVFTYHVFNPRWALFDSKNELKPFFPDHFEQGDKPELYCPTGAIWWAELGAYLKNKDFYGPGLRPFLLPWYRALDIDTQEDFNMAEIVSAGLCSKPELNV